ncbi:MAG TPA: hypothetical protein VG013_38530 [Gemmataceae bacterium]|jgi:hypothetical protein|nr:hypothetical protein [Gemmataceae bacterium]
MVRAVYSYHAKKGTWPADLQDLVPGFLPAVPDRWGYIYSKGDPAPRLMKLSALHTYLTYYFPPATHPLFPAGVDAGWVRDFEGQQMYLAGD